MKFHALNLALVLNLCACATPPLAIPQEPGTGVLLIRKGDKVFHVTSEKKDYLIRNGVPAEWLSRKDGRGWILSQEHENEAADILLKQRNP